MDSAKCQHCQYKANLDHSPVIEAPFNDPGPVLAFKNDNASNYQNPMLTLFIRLTLTITKQQP